MQNALVTLFPTRSGGTATELAGRTVFAHARHLRLCSEAVVDEAAADAAISDYCRNLAELAALEAAEPADIWAKAAALETCVVRHAGQPSMIEGDCGLAVSLLRDLGRPAAWVQDAGGSRAPSRLTEEPICRTLARAGLQSRAATGS